MLQGVATGLDTTGGSAPADIPGRTLAAGEKCWVLAATAQKDGVQFKLYTDADGNGIRYHADLKILFPNKKEVPSVDTAMNLVAEVLTVVPQDNQAVQQAAEPAPVAVPNPVQEGPPPPIAGQYSAPGGSRLLLLPDSTFTKFMGGGQGHGQYAVNGDNLTLTFTSTGFSQQFKLQSGNLLDVNTQQAWARTGDAPAAAPAPLPEIAPPPPPADAAPPPTIEVGQTMDQVIAGFGQPLRVAKLGVKTIFYYKDMKATFTNGKISNVE